MTYSNPATTRGGRCTGPHGWRNERRWRTHSAVARDRGGLVGAPSVPTATGTLFAPRKVLKGQAWTDVAVSLLHTRHKIHLGFPQVRREGTQTTPVPDTPVPAEPGESSRTQPSTRRWCVWTVPYCPKHVPLLTDRCRAPTPNLSTLDHT